MTHFIRGVIALLFLGAAVPAQAAIKVLATTADWGTLVTELGGDRVNVYTATGALQDVHRVDAKPSLVARARTADLLVANGAELEIGWLPVLVRAARRAAAPAPARFGDVVLCIPAPRVMAPTSTAASRSRRSASCE